MSREAGHATDLNSTASENAADISIRLPAFASAVSIAIP